MVMMTTLTIYPSIILSLLLFSFIVFFTSTTHAIQAEAEAEAGAGSDTKQSGLQETGIATIDTPEKPEEQPETTKTTGPPLEGDHQPGTVGFIENSKFSLHASPTTTIDIMNGMWINGPNITVSCKSKDNDLGTHSIAPNHYFYWKFRPAVFKMTLYWCNWNWGSKHLEFEVYNEEKNFHMCKVPAPNYSNVCHWQARADGIYFTPSLNQPKSSPKWEKKYSW